VPTELGNEEFVTGLFTLTNEKDREQSELTSEGQSEGTSQDEETGQFEGTNEDQGERFREGHGDQTPEAYDRLDLGLQIDDFIPLLRHEAIVCDMRQQIEEDKAVAVLAATEDQRLHYESIIDKLNSRLNSSGLTQDVTDQTETHQHYNASCDKDKMADKEEELLSSLEAERQIKFNEALNKAVAKRDLEIEKLLHRQTTLLRDIEVLKNQLSDQPASSPSSATPPGDNVAEASGSTDSTQHSTSRDTLSKSTIVHPVTRHGVKDVTGMSASSYSVSLLGQSFMTVPESGVSLEEHVGRLEHALKKQLDENSSLQCKVAELTGRGPAQPGGREVISCSTCNDGDIILFIWSETHSQYKAFLSPDCMLHFMHSDSIESLHLSAGIKNKASLQHWIVLQVTNKEYCLAKKANNRFKVPCGTKFYRVRAKSWSPSGKVHTRDAGRQSSSSTCTSGVSVAESDEVMSV